MSKGTGKTKVTVLNFNLLSGNKFDCDAKVATVLIFFTVVTILSISLIMSGSESDVIANFIRSSISKTFGI